MYCHHFIFFFLIAVLLQQTTSCSSLQGSISQGLVSSASNSLWVWSSPSWHPHPPPSYCCFSSRCSWNPINGRQVWAMGFLFAFLASRASLSGHRLSVVASVAGRILTLWRATGMSALALVWWQLWALVLINQELAKSSENSPSLPSPPQETHWLQWLPLSVLLTTAIRPILLCFHLCTYS